MPAIFNIPTPTICPVTADPKDSQIGVSKISEQTTDPKGTI
jgi:hypothetical protein